MSQHCVALDVYHRPGSQGCTTQLREAMPEAEVGEPDDTGIIEVRVEAESFDRALEIVWNGLAAAGCDDHICFAEHPDIPEHWRRRGYDGPPGALV